MNKKAYSIIRWIDISVWNCFNKKVKNLYSYLNQEQEGVDRGEIGEHFGEPRLRLWRPSHRAPLGGAELLDDAAHCQDDQGDPLLPTQLLLEDNLKEMRVRVVDGSRDL